MTEVLRTTLEENLRDDRGDASRYLARAGPARDLRRRAFLRRLPRRPRLRASRRCARPCAAAPRSVVLCDTNGGSLPWDDRSGRAPRCVAALAAPASASTPTTTPAAASPTALAAVRAGAPHVQGTINGYGERCGNANLSRDHPEPGAQARLALPAARRARASSASSRASSPRSPTSRPTRTWPTSASSAFAHKGGVHVAAMRRHADSYQHVDPALVGNAMRVVVSELSGRGNVLAQGRGARRRRSARAPSCEALEEIKEAEARGCPYESAEASVALLLAAQGARTTQPLFERDRLPGAGRPAPRQRDVRRGDGQGPGRHAARSTPPPRATARSAPSTRALRKALSPVYPALDEHPPRRLQGPYPGRQRRHRGHHARADRQPRRARHAGAPSAPRRTSSRPRSTRWSTHRVRPDPELGPSYRPGRHRALERARQRSPAAAAQDSTRRRGLSRALHTSSSSRHTPSPRTCVESRGEDGEREARQ